MKPVATAQGLLEDCYADRDCLYYMALGYYMLDDVVYSRKCLDKLLMIAPNWQAILLLGHRRGQDHERRCPLYFLSCP